MLHAIKIKTVIEGKLESYNTKISKLPTFILRRIRKASDNGSGHLWT